MPRPAAASAWRADRLVDHLAEADGAHLKAVTVDAAQVGQHPPLGEGAEGRVAAGVDLLDDVAGALGDLPGVAAEDHVDVALDRGQGRLDLMRGLPQVAGLLDVRALADVVDLGEQARDEAHAGGADQAAVRVLARLEHCEDVRIAAGLQDEVDLGVAGEFVEATVGAAADAVLAGERDPRGRGVRVEHVADLDPGTPRSALRIARP